MSKKFKKITIIIPIIIATLSLSLNTFQYLDNRNIQISKISMEIQLDSLKRKNDSIKELRSLLELTNMRPSFQMSYYQMDLGTYHSLKYLSKDVPKENKLVQSHPLITSKYLSNNLSGDTSGYHIMVLMIKQVGGSRADDIELMTEPISANTNFSFQDGITYLPNNTNVESETIKLGQLNIGESIVIPLFIFEKLSQKSLENINYEYFYTIVANGIKPTVIKFKSVRGNYLEQKVREVLKYPFDLSVSISERG